MTTFNVAGGAQLSSALSASRAGDTILLAGGDYGDLVLNGSLNPGYKFSSPVTIASADPDDPAVFGRLSLGNVKNVTIDGLRFDFVANASTPASATPFVVDGSSDIVIRNATFDGDVFKGASAMENGYGTGYGLMILRSQGVILEDSEFFGFREGALFSKVGDLTVRNNEFHDMAGDATKFLEITGAVIEGNVIRDFRSSPDNGFHRDMIQFLTASTTTPSSDIVIRGNVLHSGEGGWSQSIFFGNEAVNLYGAGQEMFYRNILIEDNLVYNSHSHGIAVFDARGLTVRNNTVLHNSAGGDYNSVYIPAINISTSSQDVAITKNIAHAITSAPGWNIAGNLIVQNINPLGANYYGDLFVGADEPAALVEALQALPGGLIAAQGVGAAMTRFDPNPDALTALASHYSDKGVHHFDAGFTAGPAGLVGVGGTYRWDFGDGTTATGRTVSHGYATPGDYEVTLAVIQGAAQDEFSILVRSPDPVLLDLRFGAGGPDDVSSYDMPVAYYGSAVPQPSGAFHLTNDNFVAVDHYQAAHLHGLGEFSLTFDLQRDSAATGTGKIIAIYKSWDVSMDLSGRLVFSITNDADESFKLVANKAITDTAWHGIEITYDSGAGQATLQIDGVPSGAIAVHGSTPAMSSWGLVIGNSWGASFNGNLREVELFSEGGAGGSGAAGPETGGAVDPDTVPDAGGPVEPEAVAPVPPAPGGATEAPALDGDLGLIAAAIGSGDYAGLAADLSKTFVTGGIGDAGDNVVLAGATGQATARGGDDVLIGGAGKNLLIGGDGEDIMFGGGGADDFQFMGYHVTGSQRDTVMDLDFAQGDRLILAGYQNGVFSAAAKGAGLNVFSGGASAIVSSDEGLARLAALSDEVTLETREGSGFMTLGITQGGILQEIDLIGDTVAPVPPAPGGATEAPALDGDLGLIAAAIGSGDYAGLAADLSKTFVTGGIGDAGDNVVLAGATGQATARGGDDVLIGGAGKNLLIGGDGEDIMFGGGGADDFQFMGYHVTGSRAGHGHGSRFRPGGPSHPRGLSERRLLGGGQGRRAERVQRGGVRHRQFG